MRHVLLFLFIVLFCSLSVSSQYGEPYYVSGAMRAYKMEFVDFNQDGLVDIAGPSRNPNNYFEFVVLYGDANEEFHTRKSHFNHYNDSRLPYVILDWNLDGLPDVVEGAYELELRLQNSNNELTLADEQDILTDMEIWGMDKGDIDNDGDEDIIYAGTQAGKVYALFNGNSSTLNLPVLIDAGINGSVSSERLPYCADFNGDNYADFICRRGVEIQLWQNAGNGTFGTPATLYTNSTYADPLLRDFNNDGYTDICYITSLGKVLVGIGNGNFTFQPAVQVNTPDPDMSGHDRRAGAADINGDSNIDIVVTNSDGYTLAHYINDGEGDFTPTGGTEFGATGFQEAMSHWDFTGEGYASFAALHSRFSGSQSLGYFGHLLKNDGSGNLDPIFFNSATSGFSDAMLADMDGDGDKDILCSDSDYLFWHENQGNNQFYQRHQIAVNNGNGADLDAADYDQDGDMDVLYVQSEFPTFLLRVYKNAGNGVFNTFVNVENALNGLWTCMWLDFDDDGWEDVVAGFGSPTTDLVWYKNQGNGTFANEQSLDGNAAPIVLKAQDLDNDGDQDILYSSATFVDHIINDEGVTFTSGPAIQTNTGAVKFIIAKQLDADPEMEYFVSKSSNYDQLRLYNGYDEVNEIALYETIIGTTPVISGMGQNDYDLDNDPDLFVSTWNNVDSLENVYMLSNLGDNTFAPMVALPQKFVRPESLIFEDMDGDGDDELIVFESELGIQILNNETIAAPDIEDYPCEVADINQDNEVNYDDILLLIDMVGCDNCAGDIDESGEVDMTDVLIVINNYGNTCD